MDGNKLGKDDYESYSGSTVIILKNSFIRKLGLGVHTLRIVSADGYATTQFTIRKVPNTGDSSNLLLWALLLVAAIAIVVRERGLRTAQGPRA